MILNMTRHLFDTKLLSEEVLVSCKFGPLKIILVKFGKSENKNFYDRNLCFIVHHVDLIKANDYPSYSYTNQQMYIP